MSGPVRERKARIPRAGQTAPVWEECWLSLSLSASATRLDCMPPRMGPCPPMARSFSARVSCRHLLVSARAHIDLHAHPYFLRDPIVVLIISPHFCHPARLVRLARVLLLLL